MAEWIMEYRRGGGGGYERGEERGERDVGKESWRKNEGGDGRGGVNGEETGEMKKKMEEEIG